MLAAAEIRDLYDNAPCGYFSFDSSNLVTNINRTLLNWLGYSEEDVIGKVRYQDLLGSDSRLKFLSTFKEDSEKRKKPGYVLVERCNWIPFVEPPASFEATAKIRYNHPGTPATVTPAVDGRAKVKLHLPQRAITPGQAAVFYQDDLVVGGGWIMR
jgi:PAS domain-containing protein